MNISKHLLMMHLSSILCAFQHQQSREESSRTCIFQRSPAHDTSMKCIAQRDMLASTDGSHSVLLQTWSSEDLQLLWMQLLQTSRIYLSWLWRCCTSSSLWLQMPWALHLWDHLEYELEANQMLSSRISTADSSPLQVCRSAPRCMCMVSCGHQWLWSVDAEFHLHCAGWSASTAGWESMQTLFWASLLEYLWLAVGQLV